MNIFLFSYISIDNILASEIIFTVNKIGPYFIINPYFSPLPNSVFVNNALTVLYFNHNNFLLVD